MSEERTHTVSRREPIVTNVVTAEGKKLRFEAHPIARWRERNDFGNQVVQEYVRAMNAWLHAVESTGGDLLMEGQSFESVIDYPRLFQMAYPKGSTEDFDELDFDSMIAVLDAALEVNGLERQSYMLDPRKKEQTPDQTQESPS